VLETPHTVVAAAIAVKSGNPYLAIPLAILSHFVLDRTPHWNPHLIAKDGTVNKIDTNSLKIIVLDSSFALIIGSAIALSFLPDFKKTLLVFVCCFLAVLPDVIEAPYIFLNYKKESLKKWLFFQKKNQFNTNMTWGVVSQIITVAAAIWWMVQK
jgi:hypothetical protein